MIEDRHRVWYNPNQKDAWFIPISELLTVITVLAIMLAAAAAVREKERGTIIEQLLVSPLTPALILLPKVISMTLVILAGTPVAEDLSWLPILQASRRRSRSAAGSPPRCCCAGPT